MFKNIVTFAILASALVGADRIVDPVDFDTRDLFTLSENDIDVEAQVLSTRESTTLPGFATFERLNTNSLGSSEIGYYGGIYYRGIVAANNTLVRAIEPRTGINFAVYGGATSLTSSRFITSRFPRTRSTSFGINSFFFGCAGSGGATGAVCIVALAGYDNLNKLVAYQTFTYIPTGRAPYALAAAIPRSTFNSGIVTLRVATRYGRSVVNGSTVFDNIKYTVVQEALNVTAPQPPFVNASAPQH